MNAAFFGAVRSSLFGGKLTQHQVDVLERIFAAWANYGDGDDRKLAYILATAYHETGRFKWLREIWGPTAAQKRYEGRADLGNTVKGDGKRFMGRGLVHITGRRNYADWAKRLGIDIVSNPELAERVDIAARILVQGMMLGTFTGKKLADYPVDFVNARRIVNGTDRAALIARYAEAFLAAQRAAGKPGKPVPAPSDPATPKPATSGLGWLIALIILAAVVAAIFFLRF